MRLSLALPSPSDQTVDVLTVGLNSIDLLTVVQPYPERNSKHPLRAFAQLPGGPAATAAVGVARLGWRVAYVGRFGDDEFGRVGQQTLRDEDVDISDVVVVAGATSRFAVVLVEKGTGARTVLWHQHERLTMGAADVPDRAILRARIVHVDCSEVPAVTSAAARARAAGIPTVIDVEQVRPGIEALLAHIDIIIAAEGFPEALTGKTSTGAALAALQLATAASLVCVTLGEQGSLARVDGREIHTPAFRVDVVDTTGAGDAFRAGFIAGWLQHGQGAPAAAVLRYASAVAALKCRALGAQTSLPRRDEVDALLQPFSASSV